MSLNNRIDALEPRTRKAAEEAIAVLKAMGVRYYISETRRSTQVQGAYFAQGRQPLEQVNALRSIAGLWPLTEAENKRQITQTLKSKHIDGKAIDIVPADKNGGPNWNAKEPEWKGISDVMKACGFEWGGDWQGSWDKPHYQIKE